MNYLAEMESLHDEERLAFYEGLAHNLTIAGRDVWSSDEAPVDKVDQLKWLNEIQHRVTAKIRVLRTKHHAWTEQDSWDDIQHWIAQNPKNESRVSWAVRAALRTARRSENRA